MKIVENIFTFLVIVGLLFGLGWLGYISVKFMIAQFGVVDARTSAILTIGSVAVLLSAIIIAGAIRSRASDSDKYIHPEKAVLYSKFLECWFTGDEQERHKKLGYLKEHMLIWASDAVLEEYLDLLEGFEQTGFNELSEQACKVLAAIRKDLGAENKSLDEERIKRLLI